jgi:hypothetical protein
VIYLDSYALVKLAHPEPHSDALSAWLRARPGRLAVSSALARVETSRALWRSDPDALPRLPALLARLVLLPMDDPILATASALRDPLLRSMDAIHLASAVRLGSAALTFVTYDKRLAASAAAAGLDVAEPTGA